MLAFDGKLDQLVALDNRRTYAPSAAAIVTLLTHFVDATEIWKHYSKLSDASELETYEHTVRKASSKPVDGSPGAPTVFDGPPWTVLHVLGSTEKRAEGAAIYWLAFCPERSRIYEGRDELLCILLCRHETLQRVRSAASSSLSMHGYNQFLLDRDTALAHSGRSVSEPGFVLQPNVKPTTTAFVDRYSMYLRAGYGRSIARADPVAFMLCPHVDFNATSLTFGADPSANVKRAIRYLWARDHIAYDESDEAPPEVPLAAVAFSQGGLALWPLLQKMGGEISAVMSVAANETLANMSTVKSWLDKSEDNLFFMVVGQTSNWSRTGKGAVEALVDTDSDYQRYQKATPPRFSVFPSPSRRYRFYRPGPPSQNKDCGPIWYAAVNNLPVGEAGRRLIEPHDPLHPLKDADEREAHHAWAFFGGPDEDPAPSSNVDYESFLDRFLATIQKIRKKPSP
ncbi:hypothetical protein A7982_13888 [Minicystis rosea]|nr:hypothetical protein A7982_13888 [Minicystis rosea]